MSIEYLPWCQGSRSPYDYLSSKVYVPWCQVSRSPYDYLSSKVYVYVIMSSIEESIRLFILEGSMSMSMYFRGVHTIIYPRRVYVHRFESKCLSIRLCQSDILSLSTVWSLRVSTLIMSSSRSPVRSLRLFILEGSMSIEGVHDVKFEESIRSIFPQRVYLHRPVLESLTLSVCLSLFRDTMLVQMCQ